MLGCFCKRWKSGAYKSFCEWTPLGGLKVSLNYFGELALKRCNSESSLWYRRQSGSWEMASTMRLMGLSRTTLMSLISLIPFRWETLLTGSGKTDCLPVTCKRSNFETCSSIFCYTANCLARLLASILLFYWILNAWRITLASMPAGTKYFSNCLSFKELRYSSMRFITILLSPKQ